MDIELPVVIERQPDYTPCGATGLHAIDPYWGDPIDLASVIAETPKLPTGGTLSVHLAVHALRRGYEVDTWASSVHRLIGAIFLGVGTDDGNLLRTRPKDWRERLERRLS